MEFVSFYGSKQPVLGRYALFITNSEREALDQLREAYSLVYGNEYEPVSFEDVYEDDDRHYLIYREKSDNVTINVGNDEGDEEVDETIYLRDYRSASLLAIELYDYDGDLYEDNIMVAHNLSKSLRK